MLKKLLNKWKAMPDSAKSSIAFIVCSFILKGISFLTTPIFTRLMDTSQYGIIATYNSWVSILDVFALLGLTSAGVFNVGLNEYRDQRDSYISTVLTLCNIVTVLVFAVLGACKMVLGADFFVPTELFVLMFIHFLFSPAQVFWITRKKYEFKYKLPFVVTILSAVLAQLVAMAAVRAVPGDRAAVARLWSNELAALVFCLPLYVMLFWRGRSFVDWKRWKKILVFALPLLPHYLSQHLMSSADRIMVAEMVSESDAGIYSVVANISMVANIVWIAVNGSLIAHTFENLRQKQYSRINSTASALLLGYGVVCFGICLIAPEVLTILAPSSYSIGIYAVPPIAGVAFLTALYNIFANIEFYHKKSVYITTATITSAVVNLVLNYIFIPKYSFIAAAYTTLISYVVLVLMHYSGYRRSTPERIYNGKLFFAISAITILACVGCTALYINATLRYGAIAVLLLAALLGRRKILSVIRSLKK